MIGHLYTGAERESRLQALFVAEETDYGDGATIAPAGLNAILAMNVKTTPIAGQLVERQVVQPYLGARPSQRVGQHMQIEFELEAAGSGTAATPPAYDIIMRAGGMARTIVAGLATIPAAATIATGAVGRFTFAKTAKYAGLYDRIVTLTCTTGGGSGVAEFTVSAPATPQDAAVSVAAQVMTTAAPFPLIQGAVITPSAITVDFTVGDVFTLALTPERVAYTPISKFTDSASLIYERDGILYRGFGGRFGVGLKLTAKGFPVWTVKGVCLALPVDDGAVAGADYSGFREPDTTTRENLPVCDIDGFGVIFRSLTLGGMEPVYASACNAEGVKLNRKEIKLDIQIDEPALADKNFYVLAGEANGAIPQIPFALRHGVEAGRIIRVDAPNLELSTASPQDGGDDEPPQLALSGKLIPTRGVGNDEFTISIQ
ncbi:MAG TPA: hypothetical protein PKZ97_13650 [Azospirillaceae bacterium]|nr:hypothetical protein [Azospirillaceae bacterium]